MDGMGNKLQKLHDLNSQYKANQAKISRLESEIYLLKEESLSLYQLLCEEEIECRLPRVYGKFIIIDDDEWDLFDNEVVVLVAYAEYFPIENTWAAKVNYATMDKNEGISSADFCLSIKPESNYVETWDIRQHGFITSEQAIMYADSLFNEIVIESGIKTKDDSK